jgi:UDP-galactopyranose mutase
MPAHGYTAMFERMLAHPDIEVRLGVDYRDLMGEVEWKEMIYSGPVDAFFDFVYGPLPYRSLEFKHEHLPVAQHQPVGTVNYPNDHAYTRITEFKHLTGQDHPGTSIVYEFPRSEGDPYYPVPRPESAAIYEKYQALAKAEPRVHFVGRLATYRYYNMDQVVAQALKLYAELSHAELVAAGAVEGEDAHGRSIEAAARRVDRDRVHGQSSG